jgi:hypothetical protein
VIVDGYGFDGAPVLAPVEGGFGIVMAPGFENVVVAVDTTPVGIVKIAVPRLNAPSWSVNVAVITPPQVVLAVNVNGLATAGPAATRTP